MNDCKTQKVAESDIHSSKMYNPFNISPIIDDDWDENIPNLSVTPEIPKDDFVDFEEFPHLLPLNRWDDRKIKSD